MLMAIKFYSPACHACQSTDHLWRMLKREFSNVMFFHEESVAEPEELFKKYGSREEFFAEMMFEKFHLPIDLDDSLSQEEKDEYKARGETKSYGLPFFVFIDTKYPHEFEMMIGGVGIDYTFKDEIDFLTLFRETSLRFIKREQGVNYDEWLYRRMYQNPFAEKVK